ncbi:hypothetical protein Poli38472_006871 [Pythium oligandrum]|uniref:CS domain-containing protein n=1 Tax=Pythium oligandrum TaxID=41045 RepID=A0A8K1C5K9_PYTOL|nr:hypothetical protein Poli38472_006871 [Pythium oligandrum]|eukprot:TMW56861.1 hypothetical protein Poli38472_006871 [Pythium oligandrum]
MNMTSGRFDELFLTLAQQNGSIEGLLDSFFDFLHRKTDFYVVSHDPGASRMGFLPGQAQQMVLAAMNKYPLKQIDPTAARPSAPVAKQAVKAPVSTPPPVKSTPLVALNAEGKQLPVGNGGVTDKYTWTQTLDDVSIHVDLPTGTRSRDIDCQIRAQHVRVALKRPSERNDDGVLLEGDLPDKIRADESIWSIESSTSTLQISLEKIKKTWWASALVGDAEIDTSQVDSTRQIHEYDDATQAAIRKAMFDQQQQQRGLPTSDQMQMQNLLAQARNAPNAPI